MPSSRKRVLREEDYVEKLEEIISSTYFPDQSCPETRAGALTKFHDTFISEDNENFHNIHQKDRNDHRRRHAYAYGDVKLLMDGVSDGDNNGGGLVKVSAVKLIMQTFSGTLTIFICEISSI